ncbi:LLM class flavin-dependent oxidoreductase [Stutzerimonas kirkiae]|uniref:LLM class flavin-dependent oxidoreductase n=1 Tax=Stutzerimonas kirkiae TaxID=2211392 RepID=A0A4Q9RDE1_9GAMM|nr:NtaA/DmoA family FMN-dependent monooxygenase [Stutzerimonas kirkiae]TBU98522.1 LLM class flavin-dependent oxidoreductase [Stutzerimonas kirkiae]TBV04303.1 LLM class flavin-dependent oxidoreductase [Stutzerimonas kirkiae]
MSTRKRLHIGMSLAPAWMTGDAWHRADSNVEGLFSSDFALDIARRAEAAHLDFVFRPDVSYLAVDVLESGFGFTSLDPTLLLASIARETSHIGLVSTISTTFCPPYMAARQLQSLNWLSNGRAGWNIVTALQGHENFGLDQMPSAEERYRWAAEFTQVVHQLWNSFPNEALLIDREQGRYADVSRIKPIDHQGEHLRVKGPLNLPAFKARIPLVQAGASDSGRDFAASVADLVFAPTPDKEAALELRHDLSRRAERHGRAARDVRLLPGLNLFLAPTREQARELFMATHGRVDRARRFASIKQLVGLDLSDWPEDRPVRAADLPPASGNPASRTHSSLLRRLIEREPLRLSELLLRPEVISAAHWQVIGTVEDAVEQIADWAAAGAVDGFIAAPGGSTESMHTFLEQVVPRLVELGLFRERYRGTTFAEHLED